jgi:hypothetical protein
MAVHDTYSYYFGLGIAIVLGYVLSSLRIERLLVAALLVLPDWWSRKSSKKEIMAEGNSIANGEERFTRPTVLSDWTEENVFELERRAIFSKACDFTTHSMQHSDRVNKRLGFLLPMHQGSRKQAIIGHTILLALPLSSSWEKTSSCGRSTMYVGTVHMLCQRRSVGARQSSGVGTTDGVMIRRES